MAGTSTASRAASLSGLRIVSIVASKPTGPSITDDVDDELSSRRPREALRALMLAHVALRERSDAIPRFEGSAAMVHVGEVEAAARGLFQGSAAMVHGREGTPRRGPWLAAQEARSEDVNEEKVGNNFT